MNLARIRRGLRLACLLIVGWVGQAPASDMMDAIAPQPIADPATQDAVIEDVLNDASLKNTSTSSGSVEYGTSYANDYGCGGDCCGGCGMCDDCCYDGPFAKLLARIQRSDRCFNQFISPVTNPVFFEDPRNLTEARAIFLQHRMPGALGGGNVQLYAMQLRAALTDRWSLIAIKDGFAVADQAAPLDDGWADVGLGLKYQIWSDCCNTRLLSGGLTFELPIGSTRTLQGTGDGEFNLFLSGAAELPQEWLWMSTAGIRLPTNTQEESQVFYWSNHFSHRVGCSNVFFLAEFNWYHWMRAGAQPALAGTEGLDLFNLGSTNVAGNDIVTGALGFRYKPSERYSVGFAWEAPLTERRDVIDNRLTLDLILRY